MNVRASHTDPNRCLNVNAKPSKARVLLREALMLWRAMPHPAASLRALAPRLQGDRAQGLQDLPIFVAVQASKTVSEAVGSSSVPWTAKSASHHSAK